MTNILVIIVIEVSEEHVVLTIDNNYHISGMGQCFAPITYAFMDTRFLLRVQVGVDSGSRIKVVVDGTLRGLRWNF